MMAQTLIGWIPYAAVVIAGLAAGAMITELLMDERKGAQSG